MPNNLSNMRTFLNICLLLSALFITVSCSKKSTDEPVELEVVNYSPDQTVFPNPERGFYKYTECQTGTGTGLLNVNTLRSYRDNSITLIYRIYYLKNFRDKPISQSVLDDMDSDFQVMRNAGIKCILRFAYSQQENEDDAPLSTITMHLDQLKPLFERNADVIAVLQAGFIGAWGEGYYSSNGLNSSGARFQVYTKLLETLPAKRMIAVRTPVYKQEFLQRTTNISQTEAYNMEKVSRVGFHNDCFLASTTDYGTYQNVEVEKAYLSKECMYVPMGGETCPPEGVNPADGAKAQNEMRYLRWTYLNQDYYHGVNDQWIPDGSMENIRRELGYRFQLVSGEYSAKVRPGGTFSARIILKNLGYASLFNPRLVELVLKNTESGEVYKVNTGIDPRFWRPNTENEIDTVVGIPQDIPEGEYGLYLNLPDPEETLYDNPDFSIRLANTDTWEEITGYNKLHISIDINSDNPGANYSGDLFFSKK